MADAADFMHTEPEWHELPVEPPALCERFRFVLDALLMLAVFAWLALVSLLFGETVE